jgi:cation diffusion facilitator family transporter
LISQTQPDRAANTRVIGAARLSVFAAIALIAIKVIAGLASGSLAVLAEAAHSGTDLAAALLTFAIVRVALRPPDDDHPYGHGKAEHLAALAEGTFLLLVSGAVAFSAAQRLMADDPPDVQVSWWLFAVLAAVIAIDVGRTVALRRAAETHGSPALAASALHFASDLAGTVAVIVGLLLVAFGWPEGDAVAALVVASLVAFAAARLMHENSNVLMDRAPAGVEELIRLAVATAEPGVILKRVRVRAAAGRYFVEATAGYRADAGLGESHAVADEIEGAIEAALPKADVVVHVEPHAESHDLRARASAAALTVRGVSEVHEVRVVEVDGRPELSLHLKLPATTDLAAAHALANAVEDQIAAAVPELADVHTHLEPLAAEVAASRPSSEDSAAVLEVVERLVRSATGGPARRALLRDGEDGIVLLLDISLDGGLTLEAAHRAATELEQALLDGVPGVSTVVVHTEPRRD